MRSRAVVCVLAALLLSAGSAGVPATAATAGSAGSRAAASVTTAPSGARIAAAPAASAAAVPAAASAAAPRPVPDGAVTVTVTGNAIPGARVTVDFAEGSFVAHESVSVVATGSGQPTLGAVRAATVTLLREASDSGALSVVVTLPGAAAGTYTVIATGLASATVGAATVAVGSYTVVPRSGFAEPPRGGAVAAPQTQVVTASSIEVAGNHAPGGTSTVTFAPQAFTPHEDVAFAVVGSGSATLSAVRAASVTLVSSAGADGAIGVHVTLPADAVGVYSVSAEGLSSKTRATAVITVGAGAEAVVTDAAGTVGSSSDGIWGGRVMGSPLLWAWIGGGLVALGLALVGVLRLRRT